jgi:U6 snRNA-associated Sm-like protein LSm6
MSDNAAVPTQPAETSGSPAEFLKNVVGKEVKVRIGQGIDYQGMLRFTLSSFSADA